MSDDPAFDIEVSGDVQPGQSLLIGIADIGVAGLTATDYIVSQTQAAEIGYVRTRNLPDITPFSNGTPRHPIRLYSLPESDVLVLMSEVFLPTTATDSFTESLTEWVEQTGIRDITVLFGAPFPHSEEEHVMFHVGTDEYRARLPSDTNIQRLAGGYFDGIVAELMTRTLTNDIPPTGVLITPTHLPGPDLDAALRLLEEVERVHGVRVNESELQDRAAEMNRYYAALAQRVQSLRDGDVLPDEYPDDRMFM